MSVHDAVVEYQGRLVEMIDQSDNKRLAESTFHVLPVAAEPTSDPTTAQPRVVGPFLVR